MKNNKTVDYTVTIKNVPVDALNAAWGDAIKFLMKQYGEVAEWSNNVEIDFEKACEIHPDSFFQVVSAGFTFQTMTTATKVTK